MVLKEALIGSVENKRALHHRYRYHYHHYHYPNPNPNPRYITS